MKQLSKNLFILLLASSAGFTACNSDDEPTLAQEDQQALRIESEMDAVFQDIGDISFSAMQTETGEANGRLSTGSYAWRSECATVTHNSDTRTLTIDFGSEGCVDPQGRMRSGKIIISYGSQAWTTTLEDFVIDGLAVEGSRSVAFVGNQGEQSMSMSVSLENGKVTWPDGTFATRELDWLQSYNFQETAWDITGTASGTNRNGQAYESEITSPIRYTFACLAEGARIPVQGVKVIRRTNPEKEDITVDFGNGECDNTLTVTVASVTANVEMEN